MVRVMKIMVISFKRSCACTVVFSAPDAAAGHCRPMPPPEIFGYSQASLAQSLVGTLFFSSGFWCAQDFLCALQESVSPVQWKFWNQIPLASKVKFSGVLSTFPRPQVGKSDVGPRTFLTVLEDLEC